MIDLFAERAVFFGITSNNGIFIAIMNGTDLGKMGYFE